MTDLITDLFINSFYADAIGFSFSGMTNIDIAEEFSIDPDNMDPCLINDESLLIRPHNSGDYEVGTYSDDSQITIAVIEHIIEKKDIIMPDLAYYLACVNEEELSEKYISPGYAFIQAMRKLHEGMIFPENACPKGRAGCFPLLITAPAVMFQKGSDEQLVSCIDNMVAMTHKDNRVFDAARAFAFILKSALQDRPVSEDEKIALIEKIAAVPGFFSGTKIPEVLYKIKDFYKLSFHEMSKNITNLGLIEDGFMHCTYYVVPLLAAVLTIWVKYSSNPHKALGACICLSGASDSAAFLCAQLFGACNIDIIPAQARGIIKNEDQIKDLLGRFSLLCPGH